MYPFNTETLQIRRKAHLEVVNLQRRRVRSRGDVCDIGNTKIKHQTSSVAVPGRCNAGNALRLQSVDDALNASLIVHRTVPARPGLEIEVMLLASRYYGSEGHVGRFDLQKVRQYIAL